MQNSLSSDFAERECARQELADPRRVSFVVVLWIVSLLVLLSACSDKSETSSNFDVWMNADSIDEESAPRIIAELIEIRRALEAHFWQDGRYPTDPWPDDIQTDIDDDYWDGIENLASIDALRFDNALGFESVVYHFHPIVQRNRLVVYHQGHGGTFELGIDTISGLLANGYSVMAFTMPLIGSNEPVTVRLPSGDDVGVSNHTEFMQLEQAGMSVMDIFFEPLSRALDYVEQLVAYQSVDAVGLSGGGWTVVVYAATDPRLERTYPVAAGVSFAMRTETRDVGDFEQLRERPMFDIASYLEMYLLAALEPDRGQMQIFNAYDSCCFSAFEREAQFEQYTDQLNSLLEALGGGSFEVQIDASHEGHIISPQALRWILDDLERGRAD